MLAVLGAVCAMPVQAAETPALAEPVQPAASTAAVAPAAVAPAAVAPAAEAPAAAPAAGDGSGGASGIVRMTKDYDLWIDPKRKLVIVDGQVCLREGQLEMFACPRGSKEHESIVSVNSKAQYVHAALMAIGAQPGKPVSFDPSYRPASGPIVDVYVLWEDKDGKRNRVRAQEWIKELKTDRAMSHSWVFAGSGFWTDETTGQRFYQADGGDFICVSNFPTATLDLPVASTQDNQDLLFAAWTERIPPLGTKVRLVLIPRLEEKKEAGQAEPGPTPPSPKE
jgi:hypothetical protein